MPSPAAASGSNSNYLKDVNNCHSSLSSEEVKVKKVVYIFDKHLARCTDNIAHIRGRGQMVHELITVYGLLEELVEWKVGGVVGKEDLLRFHSQDYVDFLFDGEGGGGEVMKGEELNCDDANDSCDSEDEDINGGSSDQEDLEEFGLGYDCPVFKGLGEFALRIAGGTVAAAQELVNGADIAINWNGGWHHAQRGEASGFCYVNDIVIGIHSLQKRFRQVLYVDLDAHHGDGVENAFAFSNKVMTLSFHHHEPGYFPGTGKITDVGQGRGKYHALNVPLKVGVIDTQFKFVFDSIFNAVLRNFTPDAVVVQCGADCLAKDPLGVFNLTLEGVVHCVKTVLETSIPTLLLGGGGYNLPNAARLWTSITAAAVNKELNNDIPDNKYFLKYGPDFELAVQPSLRKNENDDEYISQLIDTVIGHLISLRKRKELLN